MKITTDIEDEEKLVFSGTVGSEEQGLEYGPDGIILTVELPGNYEFNPADDWPFWDSYEARHSFSFRLPCGVESVTFAGRTLVLPKEGVVQASIVDSTEDILPAGSGGIFRSGAFSVVRGSDAYYFGFGYGEAYVQRADRPVVSKPDPIVRNYSFKLNMTGQNGSESEGECKLGSFKANWTIATGTAGYPDIIRWKADNLASCIDIAGVKFLTNNSSTETVSSGSGQKQMRCFGNGLANVVASGSTLAIEIYPEAGVGSAGGGGIYAVTGTPVRHAIISENSNGTVSYKQYIAGVEAGSWTLTQTGTPAVLGLVDASGLKKTKTEWVDSGSNQFTAFETRLVQSGTEQVVRRTVYQKFPWAEEKITEIEDPEGEARTTTWSYYDNESSDGVAYSKLKKVVNADGSWQRYEYAGFGDLSKTISGYLDAGPDAPENQCRVVEHGIETTERVLGQVVRRHFSQNNGGENREIDAIIPAATSSDPSNLVTTTQSVDGEVVSIKRPDGTMAIYERDEYMGLKTMIEWTGEPNGSGTEIIKGTKTTRVEDELGEISQEVRDIASNLVLESYEVTDRNEKGQPEVIDYSDGTTEETDYGNGTVWQKDRTGKETVSTFNSGEKLTSTVSDGISMIYTYDDAGRLLSTIRKGTDETEIVLETNFYDVFGRKTSSTDAMNNTTTFDESIDASGHLVRTTIFPGGATRIETYYKDGQLRTVGGTGAHPLKYEYGVTSEGYQWIKEIKIGAEGSEAEWAKSFTDMVGRHVKTEYSDGATERTYYNAKGQLSKQVDADGVAQVFSYSGQGQLEVSGIDRDGNGNVDDGDRVTKMEKSVVTAHGQTCLRTVTSEASESGYVTVATLDQTTNGNHKWLDVNGVQTELELVYTGDGGSTRRTALEDGSTIEEEYVYDRLVSRERKAGGSTVVESKSYEYDAHRRLWKEIDGRTNTETVATYRPTGWIHTIATGTLMTEYVHNGLGAITSGTLPGGRTLSQTYYPTGEIRAIGGTAEYPVSYTYDEHGRMKAMVTSSGTTSWHYDPKRGWMTAKTDAAGQATKYQYRPSGKLRKRTWARGISASYSYDTMGDLVGISYSDTTPSVRLSYDQRGRLVGVADAAGLHTIGYNTAGRMMSDTISGTGALSGIALTSTFDNLHRKAGFNATWGSQILASSTLTYDGASRLDSVTSGSHSAHYTYVPTSNFVQTIAYKRGGTTVTTGTKVYDGLDRLASITMIASGTTHSYVYGYNESGQRVQATREDGSYWSYAYNNRGEVTSGSKKLSNGTDALGYQYGYVFDDIGNRLTTSVNGRSATYMPNEVNEYQSRTVPGAVDVVGRAHANTIVTVNGGTATRQGNGYHKELSVNNSGSAAYVKVGVSGSRSGNITEKEGSVFTPKTPEDYEYDKDGNLLSDGRWLYGWNGENQLVKMETTEVAAISGAPRQRLTFEYDFMGLRISKKVESWTGSYYKKQYKMLYVYEGRNLVAEVPEGGQKVRSYVWGSDLSGGKAAGGIGGALFIEQEPEGKTFSVAYDGSGNVTGLFDMKDAKLSASYEYGPFGEKIGEAGIYAAINHLRWSTKYEDPESGSVCFGYRYYNSVLGRWISRDPIEESGGTNLYQFVGNNSISHFDAIGLWKQDENSFRQKRRIVFIENGDNIAGLAEKIRLNPMESKLWLYNETNETWVQSDADLVQDCKYSIPNIVRIDYGKRLGIHETGYYPTYASNVFAVWEAEVGVIKERLIAQGYLVQGPYGATAGPLDIKKSLEHKHLYGYIYVGHGVKDGDGALGYTEIDSILPDKYVKYQIAFMYLYACSSADPDEPLARKLFGLTYNSWQLNVAPKGRFLGYVGQVPFYDESGRRRVGTGAKHPEKYFPKWINKSDEKGR